MKWGKNNYLRIISILYIIFLICNTFSIISYSLEENLYFNFVILILSVITLISVYYLSRNRKQLNFKYVFYISIIMSIILYICLFFTGHNSPEVDYATFYGNGVSLANGEELSNQYLAMFPFLWGYIVLLGIVFKVVGNNYLVVVGTNVVLTFVSSLFLYKFLKKVANENAAQIGASLWLLNPINLMWCAFAFGGTAFNTLFIIGIYVLSLLLTEECKKKKVILAILSGLLIGLANQFRPIMLILIIAFALFLVFRKGSKQKNQNAGVLVLVILGYVFINSIFNITLEQNIGYKIARPSSGWSMYTGADLNTNGKYSIERAKILSEEARKVPFSASRVQKKMQEYAIESYKENGLKNISLAVKKFEILTSSVGDYSWDSFTIHIKSNTIEKFKNEIRYITNYTYYILLFLNIIFGIYLWKQKKYEIITILILFTGGFTIASLVMEASPRYFLPAMPTLIVCASLALDRLIMKEDFK